MPVILGGNTGIYLALLTPTPTVDPDAQAFITAAAITDPTQQAAINTLVVDLKGYNIWTKMKALYPFVGGTASSHKFNLKDPRDLDAAFRLVFSGGITHSSSGVDPNGINASADTKMTSASLGTSSLSMWYYSREDIITNVLIGNLNKCWFSPKLSNNFSYYALNCDFQSNNTAGWAPSNFTGLLGQNRTGTTDFKAWRNGASYKTLATVTGAGTEAGNITLFQRNGVGQYTANQCALAALGDGLTDTEAANFYTAVQAFQTTLGRSIGTQTVSDADAQAFVTNAGIVDQVEANAVNNLVIGMKADGLWTKMKAVYPMVGGSSSTMKYNLKNPLDTNAAFRLQFNGGWTFSSMGALPNGTNAYADTFFNQTTNFTSTSNASIGVYLRTNNASTGADMGAGDTGSARQGMLIFSSFGGTYYGCAMGDTFISPAPTNADSRGFYSVVRNAGVQSLHKRGNITLNVSETEAVGSVTNETIWVGGGTSGGYNFSSRETAFNFIGDALTQTEIDNLYTRIQNMQTALNRNV